MGIRENLNQVRSRIAASAKKAGRNPAEIEIVAVTKLVEAARILEVIEAGIKILGENRVQEARQKKIEIASMLLPFSCCPNFKFQISNLKFHLVGHLQKNKVRDAVRLFELIHSLDSLELAREIDKWAAKLGKIQEVLIQVNVSGEQTKFGVAPSEVRELMVQVDLLPNIKIQGLMTIAPARGAISARGATSARGDTSLGDNPEEVRPYFRALRKLKEELSQSAELKYLSMGMTDDFEVAVEEGANMVRLGRAIFGERNG